MTASPINASKRLDLPATKTLKSVNGKYFLVMLLYPSCNKLCVPYVHPAVEASLRETSRVPCFIDHHHWYIGPAQTWSELILCVAEYASVGYMAKRIQMRKNRFLAIQKMAEQKKNEALHASNANINDASNNLDLGPGLPKQTVSPFLLLSFNKSRLRTSFRWYLCCSKFELASSLRNIFPYFSFKLCLTQPQPPSGECPWDWIRNSRSKRSSRTSLVKLHRSRNSNC